MATAPPRELVTTPSGSRYEPELERICRAAAWIGRIRRETTPLSFTALVISLLNGDDALSQWFSRFAEASSVDRSAIYSESRSEPIDEKGIRDAIDNAASGSLPDATTLFSSSARNLLQQAALHTSTGSQAPTLGVRHLLAAIAFDVEGYHAEQLSRWGFKQDDFRTQLPAILLRRWGEEPQWRRLAASVGLAGEPRWAHEEILARTTASDAVRAVLRYAEHLGTERRRDNDELTTSLLLWGMLAGSDTAGSGRESACAAAFRDAVRALAGDSLITVARGYFSTDTFLNDWERGSAPAPPTRMLGAVSTNARALLENALARSPDATLTTESMIAAMLAVGDGGGRLRARLSQMGIASTEALTAKYEDLLAGMAPPPQAEPGDGDRASPITPGSEAAAPPRRAPRISIARVGADNPFDPAIEDTIGVEEEARAFARIAASTSIEPPLSIGVFGAWGTGKTFFMNLVRRHIERDLSRDASGAFHRDIVQIQFNAWHYAEQNLWASLVEHIFRELDTWLRSHDQSSTALFERLRTAQELRLEAAEEFVRARRRSRSASDRLEQAKRAASSAGLMRELKWKSVWGAFLRQLKPDERKAADDAAQALGITGVRDATEQLCAALDEAVELGGRTRVLARSLRLRLTSPKGLAAVLLCVAGVPLVTWGAANWAPLRDAEWLAQFRHGAANATAAIAALTGLVAFCTRSASAALSRLQRFELAVDEAAQEARRSVLANEDQAVAKADAELAEASRQLADAEDQVQSAALELAQESGPSRLNRFIREKATGGEYARHLGIIASVRRDFEELADIMGEGRDAQRAQWREQAEGEIESRLRVLVEENSDVLDDDEKARLLDTPREGKATPGEAEGKGARAPENRGANADAALRSFSRIVLYIDDLDRCQPDKVVEVLQAVHLLLNFRLFVVFVAVDARWTSRALREQYPGLLEDALAKEHAALSTAPRDRATAASSHDYLEKIFQIPYWVRPMDAESSRRFVSGLVARKSPPAPKPAERPDPGAATLPADPGAAAPPAPEPARGAPHPAESPPGDAAFQARGPDLPPPAAPSTPPDTHPAISPAATPLQEEKPQEVVYESLTLGTHEEEVLSRMSMFAGESPRRVLRFVNVYRLIKTSLGEDLLAEFVGTNGESPWYRALATHLAVITGAPALADVYFEHLRPLGDQDATLERLTTHLREDARIATSRDGRGVLAALALYGESVPDSAEALRVLRELAPVARRYAFSTGKM